MTGTRESEDEPGFLISRRGGGVWGASLAPVALVSYH